MGVDRFTMMVGTETNANANTPKVVLSEQPSRRVSKSPSRSHSPLPSLPPSVPAQEPATVMNAGGSKLVTRAPTSREQMDCRVILALDVQLSTFHLMDHIEWDLSPLPSSPSPSYPLPSSFPPQSPNPPHVTPELFAKTLAADLGLGGEAVPLIAHAIHEEILKHKKDAIEWGVLVPGSGVWVVVEVGEGEDREDRSP
ncbi:uncharacterized protein EI90DRAFT_1259899 [Cantharellus anzutake]|uniref:uncharacterized protein n=1 Tax=Cantharellus anzutake TaxID=1750568 RepID=UPI0019050E3F|nr:uncharacterized protein EI90DRAFT_1259899 [Cantharellus anzutake]KAF8330045.1 hypothetical protein EI90DRAFT_1259899 [Cantharellus anzutake]